MRCVVEPSSNAGGGASSRCLARAKTNNSGVEKSCVRCAADPEQRENLWSKETQIQRELVEAIDDSLPEARRPRLERRAPV